MKKRIRRKISLTVLLTLVALLLGTIGVNALIANISESQNAKAEQIIIRAFDAAIMSGELPREAVPADDAVSRVSKWGKNGLEDYLKSKGYYIDDINIAISKYLEASILYNMTNEENTYIMSLVEKGYDFEKVVDLFLFIQNTNHGIELLREIYDNGDPNYATVFWIEDTYERMIYGDEEPLSLDDIMGYQAKDISTEDILMTFELSLKGDMSTRQILEAKLSGQAWSEIIAKAYASEELPPDLFAALPDLRDINSIIGIARQTNQRIMDIIENINGQVLVKEDVHAKLSIKRDELVASKQSLNIKGRDEIVSVAKEKASNLDEETITQYLASGMRIKDIEMKAKEDLKNATKKGGTR